MPSRHGFQGPANAHLAASGAAATPGAGFGRPERHAGGAAPAAPPCCPAQVGSIAVVSARVQIKQVFPAAFDINAAPPCCPVHVAPNPQQLVGTELWPAQCKQSSRLQHDNTAIQPSPPPCSGPAHLARRPVRAPPAACASPAPFWSAARPPRCGPRRTAPAQIEQQPRRVTQGGRNNQNDRMMCASDVVPDVENLWSSWASGQSVCAVWGWHTNRTMKVGVSSNVPSQAVHQAHACLGAAAHVVQHLVQVNITLKQTANKRSPQRAACLGAAAHVQHFVQVQVKATLEHAGALPRLVAHVRGGRGALQ